VQIHSGGRHTLNPRALLGCFDEWQRRQSLTAVPVAVLKRYGDDRGGSLSSLLAFYGFLSLFPLLLLFVTIAGLVLGPNSPAEHRLVHSALSQFPVVGQDLQGSIRAISGAAPLAFAISLISLLWGSLGITNGLQQASATIWEVPRRRQPKLVQRVVRGLLLLGTIAIAVVGSTVLSGLSAIGGGLRGYPAASYAVTLIGAALINFGAYLVALQILAPEGTSWRRLVPGALIGGIGWTVLQTVGVLLVGHTLKNSSQLYGFFGIVLGLVFLISLGSQLFVYAEEANVVLIRRLWPRHLNDPPPEMVRVPAGQSATRNS
jgi:YihY family inner membrane protein